MSEELTEADKKFAVLLQRAVTMARDLQSEGLAIEQVLTILFAAAGVTVACSANPVPLFSMIEDVNKCFVYGAKSQGVDL